MIMGKEKSKQWKGDSPSEDSMLKSSSPVTADTHYKQACNVKGLWGILEFENYSAMFIGDEPALTAWIPFDNGLGGTIVRWIYAENNEEVERYLEKIPESNWTVDGIVQITSEVMYMFDSVEAVDETSEDLIIISLKTGSYEILTQEYKPDENTHLRLHRFRMKKEK